MPSIGKDCMGVCFHKGSLFGAGLKGNQKDTTNLLGPHFDTPIRDSVAMYGRHQSIGEVSSVP